MTRYALLLTLVCLAGCGRVPPVGQISVAAASNLTDAFQEIGREFTRRTGIPVAFNFASTAQLAYQIENAAPFDVFAAADREHVEALVRSGRIEQVGSGIFARGQLALWSSNHPELRALSDLQRAEVRYVAIASPGSAPYGRAAVEALKSARLWEAVERKIVYANNINMAKQLAATGNADAAITSISLVLKDRGAIPIDDRLHLPIDLAIGVVTRSARHQNAARFVAFVLGEDGKIILRRFGYR